MDSRFRDVRVCAWFDVEPAKDTHRGMARLQVASDPGTEPLRRALIELGGSN